MQKLPRLAGKEVVRILVKFGFIPVRQKGSHLILRKDNLGVVVPMHKELDKGTLLSIISQANLKKEEFLEKIK